MPRAKDSSRLGRGICWHLAIRHGRCVGNHRRKTRYFVLRKTSHWWAHSHVSHARDGGCLRRFLRPWKSPGLVTRALVHGIPHGMRRGGESAFYVQRPREKSQRDRLKVFEYGRAYVGASRALGRGRVEENFHFEQRSPSHRSGLCPRRRARGRR